MDTFRRLEAPNPVSLDEIVIKNNGSNLKKSLPRKNDDIDFSWKPKNRNGKIAFRLCSVLLNIYIIFTIVVYAA